MNKNYTGAGLIAVAIILFWALTLPLYNRISDLDAAIKEREDLLNSRNAIIANIKALNKEYQKRISDITKISAIVPSKKSVAEALSALNDMSTRNGVVLTNSSITGQKANDNINPYELLALDMNLNGSYIALTSFLKALESNLRLIDIASIDAAAGSGNSKVLNFVVKGNAYYLK